MKARIKFRKYGALRFIGHLDVMRFFQKVMRRADIPIAFTTGYSPHMIMSFAVPLGVGMESLGDYFDLEMAEDMATSEIAARLDEQMAEGMHIVSVRKVEDGKAGKAMALVAAADYLVEFRLGKEPSIEWKSRVEEFLAQPEIKVTKQTKRSEKEIDLRPNIYKMEVRENGFFYMLASASSNYTKPELVTNTFFKWLGEELPEFAFTVKRLEMYADQGENASPRFVTLESLGEEIE